MTKYDWSTNLQHDKEGPCILRHDFGSNVLVETNLRDRTVKRYHGNILYQEFDLDPDIDRYVNLLNNIRYEMHKMQ